jgi:hypothetical protein
MIFIQSGIINSIQRPTQTSFAFALESDCWAEEQEIKQKENQRKMAELLQKQKIEREHERIATPNLAAK